MRANLLKLLKIHLLPFSGHCTSLERGVFLKINSTAMAKRLTVEIENIDIVVDTLYTVDVICFLA